MRLHRARDPDAGLAVCGHAHREALALQEPAHQLPLPRVVVDQQYDALAAVSGRGHFIGFRRGLRQLGRHTDRKDRACPLGARDRHVAAHQATERPCDGEPEAGAAKTARGGGIGLRKPLEQLIQLLGRHADAGVRHGKLERVAIAPCPQRNLAILGELGGVADQVQQALAELHLVGVHGAQVKGHIRRKRIALLLDERAGGHRDIVHQLIGLERLGKQRHALGLDLR